MHRERMFWRNNKGSGETRSNKNKGEMNMKQYIGTKIIEADPAHFYEVTDGPTLIQPDNEEVSEAGAAVISQAEYGREGYRVRYPDGYVSWSPKDVFEAAYRPTSGMNFGLAIEAMKKGMRVRRRGWNGKGIFIELQVPDEHSKMTHPYIYIDTTGLQTDNPEAPKNRVPWLASQTDMLSDDWEAFWAF